MRGLILLGLFCALPFRASAGPTVEELRRLLDTQVHAWRWAPGDAAGVEAIHFDDSQWERVDIGHTWGPHDSSSWYRKSLRLPETIAGVAVAGKPVRLKLGVDNSAEAYVDGVQKQSFTWAEGDVLLTELAQPGQVFVIALHAHNTVGTGALIRAELACGNFPEPLRALLANLEYALSDQPYVPEENAAHWRDRVESACGALDVSAYRTNDETGFKASIAQAEERLVADAQSFPSALDALQAKNATLLKALEDGKQRLGLQLAYATAKWRVVESFLQYARDDMAQGSLRRKIRALKALQFLERVNAEAMAAVQAALQDPSQDVAVPMYRTGPVAIRNAAFEQDGRPLFFTGVGHFGQVRQDTPMLNQYGLNIIQIEMGPSNAMPAPDAIDEAAIRAQVVDALDNAAKHNVAVNLLISPHYFPQWALDQNPKLAECGMKFLHNCIDAPEAREVYRRYLDALMPLIAHHPALHSICLSNEPQYTGRCAYSREAFHAWLKDKHGDIAALNAAYTTSFSDFDDVPLPVDASNYPLYFDWCCYNQDRFAAFHRFLAERVHHYDPELPVHAKVMSEAFEEPGRFENGINHEDFNQLGTIAGNDCTQLFAGDQDGEYAQQWLRMAANYTLQHSTAPDAPIFNSEDHIITDGELRYIPAAHIRTAFWTQALHGQGAATTWVWERNQDGDHAENILTRPECVLAMGETALDLNRLAPEILALQQAKAECAIFYSHASLAVSQEHAKEALAAFEGAYFTDAVWDFVTERQALAGKLAQYKLVVVPQARHVPEEVAGAFQQYLKAGGTVLTVGECFTANEYGKARTAPPVAAHPQLMHYPLPLSPHACRDILSDLMNSTRCNRALRIEGMHGEALWGVNVRAVPYKDGLLVSLVNFLRTPQTLQVSGAATPVECRNVLSGKPVRFPLTLQPLQPALLLIEP